MMGGGVVVLGVGGRGRLVVFFQPGRGSNFNLGGSDCVESGGGGAWTVGGLNKLNYRIWPLG